MKDLMISVVIAFSSDTKMLDQCLLSLLGKSSEQVEVIVVNNGCCGLDPIKNKYPSVKFIDNTANLGASFARNQGIKASKGEYVLIADCDIIFTKEFIPYLIGKLKRISKDVDAISGMIINGYSGKIFSCGLKVSSFYRTYDLGKNKLPQTFDQGFEIDGPNSCCAVFRRSVLEEIKEKEYYDQDFFFLFEDVDLALRLKLKNKKSLFYPDLVCFHYPGSSGGTRHYRQYLSFRNRWYIILKHNQGIRLAGFLAKSFFYDFIRTVYFFLTNRYSLKAFKEIYARYQKLR